MDIKDFRNVLVIDIETISQSKSLSEVSEIGQSLWEKKSATLKNPGIKSVEELYFEKAGIFSEFGKVITIGLGFFTQTAEEEMSLRVRSLYGHNETSLLQSFQLLLEEKFSADIRLCAHNGREFDFPFLARRFLINNLSVPYTLDVRDRKPWEINHIDTLELWKFGDRKNYASLDLLAYSLGVKSSKSVMDGSQVNSVYYDQNDLVKIADYCCEDIVTTSQVLLRMNKTACLSDDNIKILPSLNTDEV